MLQLLDELTGYRIQTVDNQIAGHVDSFLFDEGVFALQYVVVDTGEWLPGRLVLISPAVLCAPNMIEKVLPVLLTKGMIESSPGIESHMPVSMEHRQALAQYYGWPLYWGGNVPGVMTSPRLPVNMVEDDCLTESEFDNEGENPLDYPLWRTTEIEGFKIVASDAKAGSIHKFLVDVPTWMIRYLIVKVGWLGGKKVILSPNLVKEINWEDSAVYINLNKRMLKHAPDYNSKAFIEREEIVQVR